MAGIYNHVSRSEYETSLTGMFAGSSFISWSKYETQSVGIFVGSENESFLAGMLAGSK